MRVKPRFNCDFADDQNYVEEMCLKSEGEK